MNREHCVSYFYVMMEAEPPSETSCFFIQNEKVQNGHSPYASAAQ
jgi:hypothetical protein